jgi:acyl-CoA thioesterase II
VEAERQVHSLHCYFMRPGDPAVPIVYEVDRIRDGGSFTTRRVVAIQHGKAIFSLEASFHRRGRGMEHQMTDAARRAAARGTEDPVRIAAGAGRHSRAIRRFWARERPLEVKPVQYRALHDAREAAADAERLGAA